MSSRTVPSAGLLWGRSFLKKFGKRLSFHRQRGKKSNITGGVCAPNGFLGSVQRCAVEEVDQASGSPALSQNARKDGARSSWARLARSEFLLRPRPARLDGSADASARAEFAFHHGPHRVTGLHDVFEDLVDDVFLEDTQIAVAEQVLFERFQLQTALFGHVANSEHAKVGQTGFGADGSELGIVDLNLVAGRLVLPGLDGRKVEVEAGFSMLVGVAGSGGHGIILVL